MGSDPNTRAPLCEWVIRTDSGKGITIAFEVKISLQEQNLVWISLVG